MKGSIIKATWPNSGKIATYWAPAGSVKKAFEAFPVTGWYRVELEIIKTCARRPAGVEHHINDYL